MGPTDLDKKQEELKVKREVYFNEGQKRLDEEAEKLGTMDAENYEEENMRGGEEEDEDNRERRGGRGGYRGGRGGRGDRGSRGGRGGRGGYRERENQYREK